MRAERTERGGMRREERESSAEREREREAAAGESSSGANSANANRRLSYPNIFHTNRQTDAAV